MHERDILKKKAIRSNDPNDWTIFTKCRNSVNSEINLFINSDAILNRDALWSIQGKKHYLQAAIVGGVHHTEKILQ